MDRNYKFNISRQPGRPTTAGHDSLGRIQNHGQMNTQKHFFSVSGRIFSSSSDIRSSKEFYKGVGLHSAASWGGQTTVDTRTVRTSENSQTSSNIAITSIQLEALADTECQRGKSLTTNGRTPEQNLQNVTFRTEQDVIYPVSRYTNDTGGVVSSNEPLSPDQTVTVRAVLEKLKFRKFTHYFNCGEDALAESVEDGYEKSADIIIRIKEQQDCSGMRKKLSATAALSNQSNGEHAAQITDDCFSIETRDFYIGHCKPELTIGGSETQARNDDIIMIDAKTKVYRSEVSAKKLKKQMMESVTNVLSHQSETLWKYSKQDETKRTGAMSLPGGKKEVVCYADI